MTKNKEDAVILSGREYHAITGYERLHMPRHTLDWSNVPRQTKAYPVLPKIMLEPKTRLDRNVFLAGHGRNEKPCAQCDHGHSSHCRQVLGLAYGYTARQRAGSQEYLYRSVPSAGALYPVEIYVSGTGIPGLPPGLFHYDIQGSFPPAAAW